MGGLSPVVASGGHSSSRCAGLSLSRPLLLRSTGSRCAGSVVVAHGPSCSAACGIFPDQGLNPCPLHWQADAQPLRHQGNPKPTFKERDNFNIIFVLVTEATTTECINSVLNSIQIVKPLVFLRALYKLPKNVRGDVKMVLCTFTFKSKFRLT